MMKNFGNFLVDFGSVDSREMAGPHGARGAIGASSEPELVQRLISELSADRFGNVTHDQDGNGYKYVDQYVITQTVEALQRYHNLLAKCLNELICSGPTKLGVEK